MKPVEDMLNFLWKKTSKGRGRSGEPPIIQALPVHGFFENEVQPSKQNTPRRSSMFVAANGDISHPLHVNASTSLEEHRFISPSENHTRNGELRLFSDPCSRDLPDKYALKNKSESQLNYLVDGPAKYYNSPKVSSRNQSSNRNSGHNRSHSVFVNIPQVSSEVTATVSKAEMEGTPRLYKKNPSISNKIMPLKGFLTNVSFSGSTTTTGSGLSDGQCPQWSFCEGGISNPVPPPRKRRNKPQESFSETSSESSTCPPDISHLTAKKDYVDEYDPLENDRDSAVSVQDPMEFSLNLPPGFSDLGLDLLADGFSADEIMSELKPKTQNLETPEQCTAVEQRDVLELESSHDPEIISTCADTHLNHNSISLSYNETKQINFKSDKLPQKSKLRSETIVKSIFAKGKKCLDDVLNSESIDTEEQTTTSVVGSNTMKEKCCEQNHLELQKTLPEFQESTKNGFTKISEYEDTLIEHRIEKHPPWYHGSSTEAVFYAPVLDEPEWTVAFCSSGRTPRNCGNGAQPDVLIGTDQKVLSSSLTSLPKHFDQSFDEGQEKNKGVEVRRLPTEEDLGHDLVVFHELQGSPSKTVIKIGEICTSQDVIEQILCLEKLPANWHLYKLCTKTLDPTVINNAFVELDLRDYPLKYLKQKDPGGDIRFELHQKERIQIRVTCDAGPERLKTVILAISCDETCRSVLDIATQKFDLKSAAEFCLIQVDRNDKECSMKRVPENQIVAQLRTDYFLLCERQFLADTSDIYNQSFESSPRIKSRSRLTYSSGSPTTVELDRLERKVVSLKTKLFECEKLCQQKLKKQQNQVDRYRAIALCTDPATKVMLLEAELQRLTIVMQDQHRQMQMHRDLSKMSGCSEDERKKTEDKLSVMEKNLSDIEKERTELYTFLQVTRTEERETSKTSASKKAAPPLHSICRAKTQGNCLYDFELDRSSLAGQEYLPCKKDVNHVGDYQNNGGLNLTEGNRILEINRRPAHHLHEKELRSVVGKMTENLHVVVLREETSNNDIYVL